MVRNSNYVFVILHYQSSKDTIECIDSINNSLSEDIKIVIVDNNSPNNSGEYLEKKYFDNSSIHVIKAKENLGFAKGNNLGYKFAKDNFNPKFIIVINNDMILKQKDFLKKINNLYSEEKFHIAGPKILTINEGINQNPSIISFDYTTQGIKNAMAERKRDLVKLRLGIYRPIILLRNIIKKVFPKKRNTEKYLKLHGSCIIFSEKYVKKYNGFFSKTFMYMEEDILAYIGYIESLKMMYDERIEIFHKEDAATNMVLKSNTDKLNFILSNELDSLTEFGKIISDFNYCKSDLYSEYNLNNIEGLK